jgi:hypothetical protein
MYLFQVTKCAKIFFFSGKFFGSPKKKFLGRETGFFSERNFEKIPKEEIPKGCWGILLVEQPGIFLILVERIQPRFWGARLCSFVFLVIRNFWGKIKFTH